MTTTTQTRPTFAKNARGYYVCPAPGCQRSFIAPAGAGRHWTANHEPKAATNGHQSQDGADPFDLDHLRSLADEVEQEKEARERLHAQLDEIEDDDAEDVEPSPAVDNGVHLLTPAQATARTTCTCLTAIDAVLALSDATTGLVDAITRLVAVGYARDEARVIVLDLIAKLDGRPA